MADRKKITLPDLFAKMSDGVPITMITCYDYAMAYLVEKAGIDMVLTGDSLGMTMLGYEGTLPVTMDDMIRHTAAVRRGSPTSWLIGDMPYMSYQPSDETAVRNAGRFMAETGCDAVKLEGGRQMASRLKAIAEAGIPVMGHLGLTPQSVSALGGFKVQGRGAEQAARIVEDARILEEAGAFSILSILVQSTFAARLVLEVLHGVGDVERGPVEAGRFQCAVEHLAGGADKGAAQRILLVARLLADQHQGGIGRTFAEHGLGGVLVKVAARAALSLRGKRMKRPFRIVDPLLPEQGEISLRASCRHFAAAPVRRHF